jgi:tetratricopeptide (TPR) repeat protein
MKNFLVFVICLLSFSLISCAKIDMSRAETAFTNSNYDDAISILGGISKRSQSYESFKLKGDAYFEINNYKDAMICYEIAVQLNNSIVIKNLVQLYFLSGNIDLALLMIEKINVNNIELSIENRKIEYVCLYRQKRLDEAEKVLNKYLSNLNNHEVIELRILSYDDSTTTVVSMLSEMYASSDLEYLEQLIDMCYSYGSFNSNFLSLLNSIYQDESVSYSFRAKCAYYISVIFKSINNNGQSIYYKSLYDSIKKSTDVVIPNRMWQ